MRSTKASVPLLSRMRWMLTESYPSVYEIQLFLSWPQVDRKSRSLITAILMSSPPFSPQVFKLMMFYPPVRRTRFCNFSMVRMISISTSGGGNHIERTFWLSHSRKSENFLYRLLMTLTLTTFYTKTLPKCLSSWFPMSKTIAILSLPSSFYWRI